MCFVGVVDVGAVEPADGDCEDELEEAEGEVEDEEGEGG